MPPMYNWERHECLIEKTFFTKSNGPHSCCRGGDPNTPIISSVSDESQIGNIKKKWYMGEMDLDCIF